MTHLAAWGVALLVGALPPDTDKVSEEAMFGCQRDADCVAVPKAGCCRNGLRHAVNHRFVRAYYAQTPCLSEIGCPLIFIYDNRIPYCDAQSCRCELRYPHGAASQ